LKKVFLLALLSTGLMACNKIDVFEKNVAIRNHEWQSSFQPAITFNIEDTASTYNLYIVLRHADAYNFNNIWLKCTVIFPDSTKKSQQYNLSLANNENGWTGTGMDDIFETRVLIQPRTKFNRLGQYQFILQQIMREDPLEHVLNVGVRVEKVI
jgi:gliding motility-associated lipoprotein GldH